MPPSTPHRDQILELNAEITLKLNQARLEAATILLEIAADQQHLNPKEARIAASAVLRAAIPGMPFLPTNQSRGAQAPGHPEDVPSRMDPPHLLDGIFDSLQTRIARANHLREEKHNRDRDAFLKYHRERNAPVSTSPEQSEGSASASTSPEQSEGSPHQTGTRAHPAPHQPYTPPSTPQAPPSPTQPGG